MADKKNNTPPVVPRPLKPGDTIGIAAPASPFDMGLFETGCSVIRSMGFKVDVDDVIYRKNRWLAGTDIQRANHLNHLFEDQKVKAIMCARGGYGSMRLLPFLDIDSIRNNPKIFMGFSDISALLVFFYQRCGFVTFHGPVVTMLGKKDLVTMDSVAACLTSGRPVTIRSDEGKVIRFGTAAGPVLCSNLTTLCHLCGTPFMPDLKGHILVVEDCGEKPYRIDRMFSQLKLSGHLDQIAGLGLGSFEHCGDGDDLDGIIKDLFGDNSIPVMGGLPVGHGSTNVTVPVGLFAVLDTDKRHLAYMDSH